MSALLHKACLTHPAREAVARCPECTQFFCRECVVEHEDRVICASCLKKISGKSPVKGSKWAQGMRHLLLFGTSFLVCWLLFYWLGQWLLSFPAEFHEGMDS